MGIIREPAVAGTFYPDDPRLLAREIKGYLNNAEFEAIDGDVTGLISPHAGYMYSGQVAAYGMKALEGSSYNSVIVIAPSHRAYFEGAALMAKGKYRTPLGDIDIDEDLAEAVAKEDRVIMVNPEVHRGEHSLEVQLPFLQTVLSNFRLVPLIMGSQETDTCERLGAAIYKVMKDKTRHCLIVGSTDLSHYYSYAQAVKLDSLVVSRLEKFDIEGMKEDFGAEKCEACGKGPTLVTMMVSRALGATKSRVLKYANSGDVSGDRGSVVGYTSAVFYKVKGSQGGAS